MKNETGFQEGRESGMVVPEGIAKCEGVGKELQWKLETSKANSLLSRLIENYIDSGKRIIWILITPLPNYLPLSDLLFSKEDSE